jgi:hypothetical protein
MVEIAMYNERDDVAVETLEAGGLRTTLMDAVEAATLRARQLGEAFLDKP